MKTLSKFLLAITIVIIAFSSCKKKNDIGRMIPANALFVAQVDMKSLDTKLPWSEIQQTDWYKKAFSDSSTPEWRKNILENPSASGIDFDEGLIFFGAKDTTGYYIAAEGKLKTAEDFEAFNKNFDSAQTVTKEGSINLLVLKDKNVVGWNDKHFIYVMNPATTSSQMYRWGDSDRAPDNNTIEDRSAELITLCKKLFSLKSSASLGENDQFSSLLKEPGDIHLWQNTEEIIKSGPSMGVLSMLKLDAFTKDNISTYTVAFDDGKIDINQKGYVSKELADILKKYTGTSVNMDMIKNIPSQNVIGVFAMNYKPEGLKELIKLTGIDGFINMYAGQMGFNLDDFVKATNGDLMVAFSDLKMKSDSFNYKDDSGRTTNANVYSRPDVNYLFSVGVADKQSFQKLIDAGKKIGNEMGGKDDLASFNLNDKTFAIGNTQPTVNQYLAGSKNKFAFTDKLSGHTIGLFVDIQKILSVLNNESLIKDADAKTIMTESMKTWNNVYFTGGEMDDDAMTGNTEINFVDQSTNSLKQLNHYFDEIAKVMLAKKEREKSKWNVPDSLMIPPPIDTVGH